MNAKIEYVKHEFTPFDLARSCFDISKARNLGYEPKIDLDLGILLTICDMQRKEDKL